ncbi:hypothetical protein [Colwellia sp. PAMC 21821]|uniref:hypothetical protein n=1 Tax=Colwellia sp. PAMC 21821 TaxID=1816219 RepID=UPI0009BCAE64|nr:hypothetical protein [Colwellia sp. PAMC 21821]ARD45131.1 hypothetical protein A3Q33_12920 [Colwellia sp. PAMC 21821]
MKNLLLAIPLVYSTLSIASDDIDVYSISQKAAIKISSAICHPLLLSQHYDGLYTKAKNNDPQYKSFGSLKECVLDENRLRKVDQKRFPELVLIQNELLLSKYKEELENLLKTGSATDQQIADAKAKVAAIETLNDGNKKVVAEAKAVEAKEQDDTNKFYGFNWAPGIALLNYNETYISDVRIETTDEADNQVNTFYIDKEVDSNIAIMLETHYLFERGDHLLKRQWGHGPFIATNVYKKENDPLSIISFGWMVAVKNKDNSSGISIGLGYFIDTDFQVTRDSLKDGDITSYTDPSKALRSVDEKGWMLIVSSKF